MVDLITKMIGRKEPQIPQRFGELPNLPINFDQVVRYIDAMYPEENYYERQQDSRQGKFICTATLASPSHNCCTNQLTGALTFPMMFGVKQDVPHYEQKFDSFRKRSQIIQAYAIMPRPINGSHPMKKHSLLWWILSQK
jgi:hypothetical protein